MFVNRSRTSLKSKFSFENFSVCLFVCLFVSLYVCNLSLNITESNIKFLPQILPSVPSSICFLPLYWELCLLIVRKGKRGQNLFTHQRSRGIVGAGPDQRNAANDIILSNVAIMPPKSSKKGKVFSHLN